MRRLLPWLPGVWILVLSVGWLLSWLSFPEVVLPLGPVAVSSLVVGGLITLRTQQNLIGPVMIIGGSAALIYDLGTAYALFSTGRNVPLPAEHLAAWLGVWPLPLLYVAASMMLLLFPAGRFDGHRKVFVLAYGLETGLVGLLHSECGLCRRLCWSTPRHSTDFANIPWATWSSRLGLY